MSGISRRDLFRGMFCQPPGRRPLAVARIESSVEPPHPRSGRSQPLPLLRPPGAISEEAFLKACTRCRACAEACPHDTIFPAPARARGATDTPVLDPFQSPCRMCPDLPCANACPTGALCLDVPVGMGTALVSLPDCLAHQNSACSACVEQCPVPGAISWDNGRPTIRPEICTGCGVCQYVCPAPRNAIILVPRRQRPEPPAKEKQRVE